MYAYQVSFNSRAPRGARPVSLAENGMNVYVSIHVPLAEHDCREGKLVDSWKVSIHVPLAEHDQSACALRHC